MKLVTTTVAFLTFTGTSVIAQEIFKPPPKCNFKNPGECRAEISLFNQKQNKIVTFALDYQRCTNFAGIDDLSIFKDKNKISIRLIPGEKCKVFSEPFCKGQSVMVQYFPLPKLRYEIMKWDGQPWDTPDPANLSILCGKCPPGVQC